MNFIEVLNESFNLDQPKYKNVVDLNKTSKLHLKNIIVKLWTKVVVVLLW